MDDASTLRNKSMNDEEALREIDRILAELESANERIRLQQLRTANRQEDIDRIQAVTRSLLASLSVKP